MELALRVGMVATEPHLVSAVLVRLMPVVVVDALMQAGLLEPEEPAAVEMLPRLILAMQGQTELLTPEVVAAAVVLP